MEFDHSLHQIVQHIVVRLRLKVDHHSKFPLYVAKCEEVLVDDDVVQDHWSYAREIVIDLYFRMFSYPKYRCNVSNSGDVKSLLLYYSILVEQQAKQ